MQDTDKAIASHVNANRIWVSPDAIGIVVTACYLSFSASYAAWQGQGFWNVFHVLLIVTLPGILAFLASLLYVVRFMGTRMIMAATMILVAVPALASGLLGSAGLLLAYGILELTGDWNHRFLRTGVALMVTLPMTCLLAVFAISKLVPTRKQQQ